MRPKVILLLAVLVIVLGGGATALILLTRAPDVAASGRYHPIVRTPTACSALSDPTFGFTIIGAFPDQDGTTAQECTGMARNSDNVPVVDVVKEVFPEPGGVRAAEDRESRSDGTPLPGTGFENDPYVGYTGDPASQDGDNCTVEYRRSNEWVKLDFSFLPGVRDLAGCRKAAVRYARPFYTSIG